MTFLSESLKVRLGRLHKDVVLLTSTAALFGLLQEGEFTLVHNRLADFSSQYLKAVKR